jgi:membrane protease YdiL (CAAX protease family)
LRFTVPIVAVIAGYTWVAASRTPPWTAHLVALAVLGLCAWRAARTREWGLRWSELGPALRGAALVTVPAVLSIVGVGWALGTWQGRTRAWRDLALLVVLACGQQFALQTVLLREAQAVTSRRVGIVLAAVVFGALHLPNPFLAPVTLLAAYTWCFLYDRHPNWLPLALSHALSSLAILASLDPGLTGRLRVGYSYLLLD